MRVLFCKIHCPSFICFCKPSPHIYTPGPLKLENSPHSPSIAVPPTNAADHVSGETNEVTEESLDGKQEQAENCLKSILKKAPSEPKEVQKNRVQWMDFLGKELVEIKEFEASEIEDTDNEGEDSRGCMCIIL